MVVQQVIAEITVIAYGDGNCVISGSMNSWETSWSSGTIISENATVLFTEEWNDAVIFWCVVLDRAFVSFASDIIRHEHIADARSWVTVSIRVLLATQLIGPLVMLHCLAVIVHIHSFIVASTDVGCKSIPHGKKVVIDNKTN